MQNKTRKKQKNYLIIALASLIAFSTMAASVMSGCGEKSESGNSEATNGTQVVTQVETDVVTETIVVDKNGNPVKQNDKQNSEGNNNSGAADSNDKNGTNNNNSSGNSNNSASASNNKSSASNANNNSAGGSSSNNSKKPDSSSSDKNNANNDSDNNNNNNNNDNNSNNKLPANADKTKYCTVNGQNYLVGDTIVCKYKLTTPKKLENFEGRINYDSKYLKVNDAILEGPAELGSMLNYGIAGRINFLGTNISKGYDYRNEDKFMIVKFKVIAPGKTTFALNWRVACEFGNSNHNYIAKDGTPADGFKTTVNYSRK